MTVTRRAFIEAAAATALMSKSDVPCVGAEVWTHGISRWGGLKYPEDFAGFDRLREWDFDIIVANWGESLTPGNEQRDYWGSTAADMPGFRKLIGIKNPAADAPIERIIFADTREELVAATKALDRVLLWHHISARNGPSTSCEPHAGTALDIQSRCLNTACRGSRTCGGGTLSARRRSR